MKFPWVSRALHVQIVGMLEKRLGEVDAERKSCLNRLGVFGLGGELFPTAKAPEPVQEEVAEEAPAATDEEMMYAALRHSPTRLAAAITNRLKRQKFAGVDNSRGQLVARIPVEVSTKTDFSQWMEQQLDAAEEEGRKAGMGTHA